MLDVRRIWDAAPHNAFTDLTWHDGEWFCVFREGEDHVSDDGKLRVITSRDGHQWSSAALLTSPEGDLRDAKISVTPDEGLMLGGAVRSTDDGPWVFRSLVWFSRDGRTWSEPLQVGDDNAWLWRFTWRRGAAYGFGYGCGEGDNFIQLCRSPDGRTFTKLTGKLLTDCYPNETQIVFGPDGTAYCLLRRDPETGMIGTAASPYTEWEWRDLGVRLGGPALIMLPDGRLVACVRRYYDDFSRTALGWVDAAAGRYDEFLELPSGGDTSYAGMVWREDRLWVSYYSSHEEKTCVYLAQVTLP
jgi:hypothetical protein